MLKGKNGDTYWPSQPKIQNQIKTKTTRQNGATRCVLTYRNGCKSSEENRVDDRVPEHRDSHACSSHGLSLEPTRSADLGKHSVYTHLPKDRNCEICQRTKITRAPMQKTQWRSRTSSCKFWWLDNSRSQGPKRQLRISKQSSTCSRGAGLSHSMDPGISVRNKNFSGNTKELAKVLGAEKETKSRSHFLSEWILASRSLEDIPPVHQME